MLTNPQSEDTIVDGKNISAEARAVAQQAATVVKDWIDKRIDDLTKETRAELTAASAAFEAQRSEVEKAMDDAAQRTNDLVDQIGQIRLLLGDGNNLSEMVANLEKATRAVNEDLERRKKMFRDGGATVASALGKAIKTLV